MAKEHEAAPKPFLVVLNSLQSVQMNKEADENEQHVEIPDNQKSNLG